MSKKELLINKIEHVPESLLDEVLDFVRFLKAKVNNGKYSAIIVSESTLRKRLAQARGR